MQYEQVIAFNPAKGGTTPGMCLANVTQGYGIPNKYASAWEAWEDTQQHTVPIPSGLDIPVFFSYTATIDGINKNWGHIGVRLSNGQFWSDGNLYASINAYTTGHAPRYIGWGESVNDVIVIKGEEMATPVSQQHADDTTAQLLYQQLYPQGGVPTRKDLDFIESFTVEGYLRWVSQDPNHQAFVAQASAPSSVKPYSGPQLYTKG